MINLFVDKVFVISTINSDRIDYIKNHLRSNNINFEFFIAPIYNILTYKKIEDTITKDSRPSLSLISSYVSIMEMSIHNNYKRICIIEDDCYFIDGWKNKFKNFYNNLPTDKFDILHVGYHPIQDTDSIFKSINQYVNTPLEWHHTTHCMLINYTIYELYKNIVFQNDFNIPVDYVFNKIYKMNYYKCYSPVDKISYQLSERNDEIKHDEGPVRFKSFI